MPKFFTVRFYKRTVTSDRMDIIVEAESPEAARAKVLNWGLTGDGLTEAEEQTESLGKEEVVDSEWHDLADPTDYAAVVEMEEGFSL